MSQSSLGFWLGRNLFFSPRVFMGFSCNGGISGVFWGFLGIVICWITWFFLHFLGILVIFNNLLWVYICMNFVILIWFSGLFHWAPPTVLRYFAGGWLCSGGSVVGKYSKSSTSCEYSGGVVLKRFRTKVCIPRLCVSVIMHYGHLIVFLPVCFSDKNVR